MGGQAPNGWNYEGGHIPQFFKKQQDNCGWILGNKIDCIIPMIYMESDWYYKRYLHTFKSFLRDTPSTGRFRDNFSKVCTGIEWDTDSEPEKVIRKINYSRLLGVRGFVIFQLHYPEDDWPLIDALKNGPFKYPARSWLGLDSDIHPEQN